MKVTIEHFSILQGAISPIDSEQLRNDYRAGNFVRSHLVSDLDVRYRWDLFWRVKNTTAANFPTADYATAHIDTVLRNIVAAL
jgi:hypothetical protein